MGWRGLEWRNDGGVQHLLFLQKKAVEPGPSRMSDALTSCAGRSDVSGVGLGPTALGYQGGPPFPKRELHLT